MSHSLYSGIVPGLVEIVLRIDNKRLVPKKVNKPACHFAASDLLFAFASSSQTSSKAI
jgi:hypothetical protein